MIVVSLILPVFVLATDDLYDYYNTGDVSSDNFYDNGWIGQSFIASGNYEISSIRVKIHRTGTPTGPAYFSIRATDELGRPTGPDLAVGSIEVSAITTSALGRWEEIVFLIPYRLEENVKYSIVARGDGANFNDFRWRRDTTSTYIGQLVHSIDSGSTWTTYEGVDLMFETYGLEYTPPVIPITSDFVLGAIAYADVVWNDFSLLALFGIGLPLGFWVVKKVVGIF